MFGNRRIRRPSHSTVVSYLALFVALGGTGAYAANTIGSSDIINESILAEDVQGQAASGANPAVDGTLTTNEIKNGTLRSADIMNGTLQALDLAAGAVNSASVLNESLTSDDLAIDSVNATEIANSSIDTGEIVDNSLFAQDLATDSVSASELRDGAVDSAKVADDTLTTADVAGADLNGGHISIAGGQVGNARCKQFDSGVAGAKAGEAVVYSSQGALQDGIILYGQRVVSDGHVTLNVCNFSGTIQAAITNLPVRVITFG
jgi:hypothetical protein